MKVLAFGEILWDIIEGVEHLGGAPFNFAAHSAQCGNESFIISRLGSDYLGITAFDKCKLYGVHNNLVQWDDKYQTGVVDVTLKNGQPDYIIKKEVAYDFITPDDPLAALQTEKFDVFYFGSLIQRNDVSAKTLHTILENGDFKYVFYDVNLRKEGYNESIIRKSLKACNILKLNIDEVPVIGRLILGEDLMEEEFCNRLKAQFPNIPIIVITAADKGCYVHSSGKLNYIPATPITLVDAVGAGDAFSAAFMHIYATTHDPVYAAKVGNKLGAFVASQSGPIPQYSPEIKSLLNRGIRSFDNVMETL